MNKQLEKLARACPAKSFKAFIGKSKTQAILCAVSGAEIVGWGGFDDSSLVLQYQRKALARYIAAADPITVLALLSRSERLDAMLTESVQALKAAEQRIAELEEKYSEVSGWYVKMKTRMLYAEERLATQVRLPQCHSMLIREDFQSDYRSQRAFKASEVMAAIRAAGFKVGGGGCVSKLTAAEQKWINDVQRVLDKCPSTRLGFFTIGDCEVVVYDLSLADEAERMLESGNAIDYGPAVLKVGAYLGSLNFPQNVESTAG